MLQEKKPNNWFSVPFCLSFRYQLKTECALSKIRDNSCTFDHFYVFRVKMYIIPLRFHLKKLVFPFLFKKFHRVVSVIIRFAHIFLHLYFFNFVYRSKKLFVIIFEKSRRRNGAVVYEFKWWILDEIRLIQLCVPFVLTVFQSHERMPCSNKFVCIKWECDKYRFTINAITNLIFNLEAKVSKEMIGCCSVFKLCLLRIVIWYLISL